MMTPDLLGLQNLKLCEPRFDIPAAPALVIHDQAGLAGTFFSRQPSDSIVKANKGISNRTPSRSQQILRHHGTLKVLGRDGTYKSVATLLRLDGRSVVKRKHGFVTTLD